MCFFFFFFLFLFFFNATATTEIYTLSLHDALPIYLSQDKGLIDAFQNGEDIHSRTASHVFNVPLESVLPEMRRTAKVVNFGIMYGAGPFRMSQELGIPRSEAVAIIESYFDQYAGIRNYIDATLEKARNDKYVETMLGRRRPVWDADSDNGLRRQAAERMAINMPIQGSRSEERRVGKECRSRWSPYH